MSSASSAKKIRILHVAKWYPHKGDIQNGVFVQKHVQATAIFCEVKVLAWLAGNGPTTTQESYEKGMAVTRTFFKPKTTISEKRHAFLHYIHSHYNSKNLPDVVHLHAFAPDLLIVIYWAKRKQIPVIATEHWTGYASGVFEAMPKWRKWAYKRLSGVNRVLPVSEGLKRSMQKCGINANFRVVPNVVTAMPIGAAKRSGFNFVIVADFVDEHKNISGAIEAFNLLDTPQKNVFLHLIGGGPDEEKILSLVELSPKNAQIKLYGRLANEDVRALLPTFNCLIINSNLETFGVVLPEAHAAGLPVITTRCGGPEFMVEEHDITINVSAISELLQAMQTMLNRPETEYRFTKWRNYLPEVVGQKMAEIYHEVMAENELLKKRKSRRSARKNQ